MKLSLVLSLAFLSGCAGADPTAESEEELSSHTYDCTIAHHSAVALSIRVSKTKTKVTAYDANEFTADIGTGSTFTLNPDYVWRVANRSSVAPSTCGTRRTRASSWSNRFARAARSAT